MLRLLSFGEWFADNVPGPMRRLLTGIVVLGLVAFLVRAVAVGTEITAANDSATLAMLKPPGGFVDAIGKRWCSGFDYCFQTSGQLQPMTQQNARTLITEFGLAVIKIGCHGQNGGLACSGEGTMSGVNRETNVFFAVVSGPHVESDNASPSPNSTGTYATFGTKALKRLPLALRFA